MTSRLHRIGAGYLSRAVLTLSEQPVHRKLYSLPQFVPSRTHPVYSQSTQSSGECL